MKHNDATQRSTKHDAMFHAAVPDNRQSSPASRIQRQSVVRLTPKWAAVSARRHWFRSSALRNSSAPGV
jgi:hypothetical protein